MRTNIYVDGFNLYYGCLRRTVYRWLDLGALCRTVLQGHHVIGRIRYFTAHAKATVSNPDLPVRQQAYIRALKTIPNLSVHLGSFQSNKCRRPRADGTGLVEVIDTKEKGSDVNLASYLLLDGFKNDYEAAVVVSNDSDLTEPIRLVRHELKLVIGILNPHATHAYELKKIPPKFHLKITAIHLAASQFPDVLNDANGTITKPARWR
jgi:uncharacterized LabA/DUF88 family protein